MRIGGAQLGTELDLWTLCSAGFWLALKFLVHLIPPRDPCNSWCT